ncbi:MAG: carboxymuconolactone decarboxylase family protein [Xanthobacteraceae bacterium]
MTVLSMEPATLPPAGRALFAEMSARRNARGEHFGGPYIALLNHPELARRIEALGFFLKFEGVLPRPAYQFIVLSVAQATGASYEWHDHVQHALAAGLPQDVVDDIAADRAETLQPPYALLQAILSKTMAWQPVPDDLQAGAVAEWGTEGLVEIVVVSGFYQMFAAINQGFAIKPPTAA